MDVEEIINKKKEQIIEEVKQETEGLHTSIANKAVEKLEEFAAELKMALDMHPIGATDLLRVIEKGGLVYQSVENTKDGMMGSDLLLRLPSSVVNRYSKGKQRVTILIEPIEEMERK